MTMPDPRPASPWRGIDATILAALRQYRDRSGHQLSVLTGAGVARLYPALARLEMAGAIESRRMDGDAEPPRRRVYRIGEDKR